METATRESKSQRSDKNERERERERGRDCERHAPFSTVPGVSGKSEVARVLSCFDIFSISAWDGVFACFGVLVVTLGGVWRVAGTGLASSSAAPWRWPGIDALASALASVASSLFPAFEDSSSLQACERRVREDGKRAPSAFTVLGRGTRDEGADLRAEVCT